MAAVPPKDLSRGTVCDAGVEQDEGSGKFSAVLAWRRKDAVAGTTLVVEHLGVKQKPWFAGVAHDLALCSRAFNAGDRSLSLLQQQQQQLAAEARSDGGGLPDNRLNFPLSCYTNQAAFWEAMEGLSFGELALKLRTSRDLEKTVFFGDTFEQGLAARRVVQQQKQQEQQQQAAQQRKQLVPPSSSSSRGDNGIAPAKRGGVLAGPPPPEAQAAGAQAQPTRTLPSSTAKVGSITATTGALPASPRAAANGEPPAPPQAAAKPAATSNRWSKVEQQSVQNHAPQQQEQAAEMAAPQPSPRKRTPPPAPPRKQAAAGRASPRKQPQAAAAVAAAPPLPQAADRGQQPQAAPPRPGTEGEPKYVWGKPAEYPPGSGKYPFYLKAGPLSKGYFTIAGQADDALFGEGGHEGEVCLQDAASDKTWRIKAHLKKQGNRSDRYLTCTTSFNRENSLQPHDVLWLSPGAPLGKQLLFGVWRWGSEESAAFAEHLTKKKRPAAAVAAAAGGGGEDDSDGDTPPAKRAADGSGGMSSVLSPASAKTLQEAEALVDD